MLNATVIVINVISAILMIVFVLLHAGRGGGLSDMFGGGGAALSGGSSVERTLDRMTVITAVIFAGSTFWLAWQWS
jgi:preprotein translocase subunit SecG